MHSTDSSIHRVSLAAVNTLLLLSGFIFLYAACRSVFFLSDVTIPEAAVVYGVEGLLSGKWALYRDYGTPPYGTTPYTPLFYLVSAMLAWFTTQSVYAIYICCRLLTLLATFGAACFVYKIALLIEKDAKTRSLFFLPFTILILIAWGFSARPDMLATMLSLAGIYIYLRRPQSLRAICFSAFILACAWGCKQSFVAAPIAVFLTLLWEKEWKRGLAFTFVYIAAITFLVGTTQYLSHGWFYDNIVTANVTILQINQVYDFAIYSCLYLAPFITGAAVLACTVYFRPIACNPCARCVMLYLLGSFLLNTAACMKDGAYYNYMLEPLFAAAIVASLAVRRMLTHRYTAMAVAPLLLATLAFSYYSDWHGDGALENALSGDIHGQNAAIQKLIDKINAFPHDVLSSRSMLAVRSNKPVLATDLFNARYLEKNHKLSTRTLAERIERQELSAVIATKGCEPSDKCGYWPPLLRKAILETYEPGETLYGYVFWYPKSK